MCARPPDLTARRSSEDRPRRAPRRRRWRVEFYFLALVLLLAVVRVLSELGAPSDAPSLARPAVQFLDGWEAALAMLRGSSTKYVVVYARNGLGNRLRALEDEHVPVLEQASPPRSSQ